MDTETRNRVRFFLIIMALVLLFLSQSPVAESTEKFVDNGDGTVTDTRRLIMRQKGDNGEEVTFPTVLLPFNYYPSRGKEVLRVYPAKQDDRAFVRAVRSIP